MAILDFLPARRGRRKDAAQLYDAIVAPVDRLHGLIHDAGVARMGEGYDEICARFVDCRILRTDQLIDFPAEDRDALYDLVVALLPQVGPAHDDVRHALERVLREWRHGGLVEAAAGGGLRALELLKGRDRPKTVQDRLFHVALFMDVDVAANDVRGELQHIAKAPSLFW